MDNELLLAIDALMDKKLQPIQEDLTGIKEDITGLKTDVSVFKTDVAELKTDVTGLKTSVAILQENVTTLQEDMENVKERTTRTEVLLENDIAMKISLIYEGHSDLNKKVGQCIKNKEEVDGLKDRVHTLEAAVTNHSKEVQDIKEKIG